MAVTDLVPNAYGPWTFCPPQRVPNWSVPLDKQSPTNSVPIERWSQKIWSPWTNGPQPICSPRQMVRGIFRLSRGKIQKDGDRIGWGPFVCGDQMFEDHLSMGKFVGGHLSRGVNFMRIICPGGQEVGDQKSRDQMGSGPNESQPIFSYLTFFGLFSASFFIKYSRYFKKKKSLPVAVKRECTF